VNDIPHRYRSKDEDSGRWTGFPFRSGDIVISSRSKTGTTWVQMICALLIFQTPELPAPLGQLSPWMDALFAPREAVWDRLAAQHHRRFIKTHTPLDGVPINPGVSYIVTARHPLDAAVSLYYQGENIDRARLRQLTGQPEPTEPPKPREPVDEWLRWWIGLDRPPREELDGLPGVLWHQSDAWARRDQPSVMLVHYDDLSADLAGEMRRLAARLGIEVPQDRWNALADAASFSRMREAAARRAPDADSVIKDPAAFFRRGRSGAARELLSDADLARYHARAAELAAPDLLAWLHRDGSGPVGVGVQGEED
jgi:aryl sulfotransferase